MSLIYERKGILDISRLVSSEELDEMFFRQIQMRGDKVMRKFPQQFADTKAKVMENVTVEYKITTVPIDEIKENKITVAGGTELESLMLARALEKSDDVALCVMTVQGYDDIEKNCEGSMDLLFVDGWGTALAECANSLIKNKMASELKKHELYTTSGWSPGQHEIDISLQKPLFRLLEPETIGIRLSETLMMYPKKSISCFVGIGTDDSIEDIRPCDVCPRRETCPSAYA